jgi:hypothetical protein
MAVGEFEYVEATGGNDNVYRVYSCPGASKYGQFALDVTTTVKN